MPPESPFSVHSFRSLKDRLPDRLKSASALALIAILSTVFASFALPLMGNQVTAIADQSPTPANTPTPTLPPTLPAPTATPLFSTPLNQGALILSINEGGFYHLFAYQPIKMPLTRLSYGAWDDITPSLSPDCRTLAFASNRSGYWDLYLLDLPGGETTQLTNTKDYDAAPSWSPDGRFLAYETYVRNLEIAIRPVFEDDAEAVLLADPTAADFSPAWSPAGDQLAFVSNRSGEDEIWIADLLENGEVQYTNASQSPLSRESHPVWSQDGESLAWSSVQNGEHRLMVTSDGAGPVFAGSGDWPAWSPDGTALAATLSGHHDTQLAAYFAAGTILVLPPMALPGPVGGLEWSSAGLTPPLTGELAAAAQATPPVLWSSQSNQATGMPPGRQSLSPLDGVTAPYAELHDAVDESFQALRERVTGAVGWDFLGTLENAFVPLTAPLAPGLGDDWLFTGRAFSFTPLGVNAGWVIVTPEDFGGETYWRVYLRARQQDGSQGTPVKEPAWEFYARYQGDPLHYEQGGNAGELPEGYWVDFTELAAAYGWQRLPALSNWHSSYPAARFNEFVFDSGLDWRQAMLELYPPEILITPTAIVPPTLTPTPAPVWYQSPTPTQVPTRTPETTPIPWSGDAQEP